MNKEYLKKAQPVVYQTLSNKKGNIVRFCILQSFSGLGNRMYLKIGRYIVNITHNFLYCTCIIFY